MKDYKEAIESIMKDTKSKVMDHAIKAYRQGYENGLGKAQTDSYVKGYEDGQKEKPQAIYEMKVEEYNKGLNEAWECARKMCLMSSEERLRAFDVSGNHLAILSDLTASKAIVKLKAFEQKCKECKKTKDPIFYGHCVGECDYAKQTEDEIKVGDEITSYTDTNNLVIGIGVWGEWNCITEYGAVFEITKEKQKYWKKTGRHFDAIPEVLKQMNREEDK